MPKTPAHDRFLNFMHNERNAAADELENYQINTATWAHNLEWNGDRMVHRAVVCEMVDHYERFMTNPRQANLRAAFVELIEELQHDVLREAQHPKRSTSPMSNLVAQVRNSVRAEFLRKAKELVIHEEGGM